MAEPGRLEGVRGGAPGVSGGAPAGVKGCACPGVKGAANAPKGVDGAPAPAAPEPPGPWPGVKGLMFGVEAAGPAGLSRHGQSPIPPAYDMSSIAWSITDTKQVPTNRKIYSQQPSPQSSSNLPRAGPWRRHGSLDALAPKALKIARAQDTSRSGLEDFSSTVSHDRLVSQIILYHRILPSTSLYFHFAIHIYIYIHISAVLYGRC